MPETIPGVSFRARRPGGYPWPLVDLSGRARPAAPGTWRSLVRGKQLAIVAAVALAVTIGFDRFKAQKA